MKSNKNITMKSIGKFVFLQIHPPLGKITIPLSIVSAYRHQSLSQSECELWKRHPHHCSSSSTMHLSTLMSKLSTFCPTICQSRVMLQIAHVIKPTSATFRPVLFPKVPNCEHSNRELVSWGSDISCDEFGVPTEFLL